MQFTQHVLAVWSLLPAFRAVAETEHLPSAALELDLGPSALSRSIKLLEQTLRTELFDHSGRTLVLNDAGRRLLESVRSAMRLVDDAVRAASGVEMAGTIIAGTTADLSPGLLAPACVAVRRQFPALEVELRVIAHAEVHDRLLSGEIDVALVSRAPNVSDVAVIELPRRCRAAYASASTTIVPATALPCVVVGTRGEYHDDGWPSDAPREIAFWANDPCTAFALCLRGDLVVTATAEEAEIHGGHLVRLEAPAIRDQQLYVVQRAAVGAHPRTELLVEAIRRTFMR